MFWREGLIAILVALLALTGVAYLNEHDSRVMIETEYRLKMDESERIRKAVKEQSDRSLKELTESHNRTLKEVENNAWANFKRRFPTYAGCLPPQPSLPRLGQTNSTSSPTVSDEVPEGRMAAFVAGCAYDAATVRDFQKWVRMNKLPVEGE
jgi:hypothetical protein